jgi:uncharacterized protein (TIGR03086 family)
MSAQPWVADADPGLELLERALAFTHAALGTVTPTDLDRPTPCTAWRLADLLAHMEDSLDAFTEGAAGTIGLRSAAPSPVDVRLASIRGKACDLLGAWTDADRRDRGLVAVGGHPVPVAVIARIAAIEVAVHGWDVAQATGHGLSLPDDFAGALLPTAGVVTSEPHAEFAAPLRPRTDAPAGVRLLARLGRTPS